VNLLLVENPLFDDRPKAAMRAIPNWPVSGNQLKLNKNILCLDGVADLAWCLRKTH
jgi:hypothetical protein